MKNCLSSNSCQCGRQAIDTVLQKGKRVNLVILDLIMPEMGGGITFDRILEIQPTMPVILASVYRINDQVCGKLQRGRNQFMKKLFSISKQSQNIRKILNKTKGSAKGKVS